MLSAEWKINNMSFNSILILIGFKGCGKSYYGKLVADELKIRYIDTDLMIEEAYVKQFNCRLSCKEISLREGEAWFRQLETQMIHSLKGVKDAVISLGGGGVLSLENRSFLKTIGSLVYLDTPKEIIKERMFKEGIPSFLDPRNPDASFEKMYQERYPLYTAISSHTINMDSKPQELVIKELFHYYCSLIGPHYQKGCACNSDFPSMVGVSKPYSR